MEARSCHNSKLSSKLKFLISRAYKAEKVYSMNGKESESSVRKFEASELRSREWGLVYRELRTTLSDLVDISQESELLAKLEQIIFRFLKGAEECEMRVDIKSADSKNALNRAEYGALFQYSSELVSLSARASALRNVSEDLINLANQNRPQEVTNLPGKVFALRRK